MILNKLLSLIGLELKESRAYQALIGLGLNDIAVWTPREYEHLTRQSYALNADVFSCVNLIAGAAKQIPWIVYAKEGGTEALNNHPLLTLLRKPNERENEADFKESAIAYTLLSGNGYIERSGGTESTPPAFLYSHRPDRMRVVKGNRRLLVSGYEYKASGAPVRFEPWEILHLRLFNPLDDFYGMSPLESLIYTVDCSNESRVLYKKLLQKGYPPGAIRVNGDDWSDEQIKDFKIGHHRASQEHQILYLGNAEWVKMGFDPVDASLFEGRRFDKRDIASAFRVPAGMIGDSASNTHANIREYRRSLYTEAVLPALMQLRDGLNAWLGPVFGNAYIDIDKDAIDALAEDREVQAKRVHLLWSSDLIKRNEGRAELKYDKVPEDEDGYYSELVKQTGVPADQPVNDDQIPQRGPNGAPRTTGTPAIERLPAANGNGRPKLVARSHDFDFSLKAFNLISEEEKAGHSQAVEAARERWYAKITADAEERFLDERNAVLKAFSAGGEANALRAVVRQEPDWTKFYRVTYLDVADEFGRRMLQSIKGDGYEHEVKFETDIFTQTVLTWLADEGAKRVSGILDVTKEAIRRELMAGVAAGETNYEMSKRLQAMYGQFSLTRSERIARTETHTASELGSHTAAKGTNLPLNKEWVSTYDQRTRDHHAAAHGQRRRMPEPYIVMGQQLMFPGDGSLGASGDNTIQCRCSQTFSVQRG